MKITKKELKKILKELEQRHIKYDDDKPRYKELAQDVNDSAFMDLLLDNPIITLNKCTTCALIDYNIIKIDDNKLILNI